MLAVDVHNRQSSLSSSDLLLLEKSDSSHDKIQTFYFDTPSRSVGGLKPGTSDKKGKRDKMQIVEEALAISKSSSSNSGQKSATTSSSVSTDLEWTSTSGTKGSGIKKKKVKKTSSSKKSTKEEEEEEDGGEKESPKRSKSDEPLKRHLELNKSKKRGSTVCTAPESPSATTSSSATSGQQRQQQHIGVAEKSRPLPHLPLRHTRSMESEYSGKLNDEEPPLPPSDLPQPPPSPGWKLRELAKVQGYQNSTQAAASPVALRKTIRTKTRNQERVEPPTRASRPSLQASQSSGSEYSGKLKDEEPPKPPSDLPEPPPSPGWKLRELAKAQGSPVSLRKNFRKKAVEQHAVEGLPDALRMAALATGNEKAERKIKKTKATKNDSKLAKKSEENNAKSDKGGKKKKSKKAEQADDSSEKQRQLKAKQEAEAAAIARLQAAIAAQKQANAPHNRPGVAHHTDKTKRLPVRRKLTGDTADHDTGEQDVLIVDRIPTTVSFHSKKSSEGNEDVSLDSWGSTLTPSVGDTEKVSEMDGSRWEILEEDDLPSRSLDSSASDIPSDSNNKHNRNPSQDMMMAKSDHTPEKRMSGWELRELAKNRKSVDMSPMKPSRMTLNVKSTKTDLEDRCKPPSVPIRDETNHTKTSPKADSKPTMPNRASQPKRDVSPFRNVTRRWTPKATSDLPPAFAMINDYSSSSELDLRKAEAADEEKKFDQNKRRFTLIGRTKSGEKGADDQSQASFISDKGSLAASITRKLMPTKSQELKSEAAEALKAKVSKWTALRAEKLKTDDLRSPQRTMSINSKVRSSKAPFSEDDRSCHSRRSRKDDDFIE